VVARFHRRRSCRQGRGYGAAMIEAGLERARTDGLGAHLSTGTERKWPSRDGSASASWRTWMRRREGRTSGSCSGIRDRGGMTALVSC
jgi:GNAT superfamily N-acetyltransferase